LVFGIAVSLLCLWLAFRSVSIVEVSRILIRARIGWLGLAVLAQILAVFTRARRWTVLLNLRGHFMDSFWIQGIGYLFTNIFPFRMGEPARILLMAERCRLRIAQVTASAVIERLVDLSTILALLLLILPWMDVPELVVRTGIIFAILVAFAMAGLLWITRPGRHGGTIIRWIEKKFPAFPTAGLRSRYEELLLGLQALKSYGLALRTLFWSLLSWGFSISMYFCVLRSFQADATPLEAVFLVVALSLAVTLPSSPGFIGIFHYVGRLALVIPFGVKYDAANAVAIVVTSHLVYYIMTTFIGVAGLWRMGETFSGIWHAIREGSALLRSRIRRTELSS
jgi:uncharacterized protein (TIRG00374 family)